MATNCEKLDCCASPLFDYEIEKPIVFAILADYGSGSPDEADVAALIKTWNPDFVITAGDNQYLGSPTGQAQYTDQLIGQFYRKFIHPYLGEYPLLEGEEDASEQRFFAAQGNHDLDTLIGQPLTDYLSASGRYYDFVKGPAHFFIINSGLNSAGVVVEPDGNAFNSVQGDWFTDALARSTSRWNFGILHHPPYSSGGDHAPVVAMQWPQFSGLDAIFSGHNHYYERLNVAGLSAFIVGTGGQTLRPWGVVVAESIARFNEDFGAIRAEVTLGNARFQFFTQAGILIDDVTLT